MDSKENETLEFQDHVENLAKEVLGNDLIWRNICKRLHFGDLKMLREVSTWLNNNVIYSEVFQNSAVLNLNKNISESSDISHIASSQVYWRHMKISIHQFTDLDFKSISHLFEEIQTLDLSLDWGSGVMDWGKGVMEWGQSSLPEMQDSVQIIFKQCTSLSFLEVDIRILEQILLVDENNSTGPNLDVFSRLQGLRVSVPQPKYVMIDSNGLFTRNLEILTLLLSKLRTFAVEEFWTLTDTNDYKSAINLLIQNNSGSLTTLELMKGEYLTEPAPTCPILQNLKTRIRLSACSPAINFISKLPFLETLEVSCNRWISFQLLNCIKERSSNLKKLHLKAKRMFTSRNILAQDAGQNLVFSWDYLKDLKFLEDFALVVPYSRSGRSASLGNPNLLLESCLPPSMKKILLRGMDDGSNTPINMSILKQNFPRLTLLSLERCNNLFDDEGLQFLCTEIDGSLPFPDLTTLAISHCAGVTDAGVNGRLTESGFPMSNRRGLRSLTIQSCQLTDGCVEGLKFQELRKLDVSGNSEISKSGIVRVLENNPSLEILKTSSAVPNICNSAGRLRLIEFKQIENMDDSDSDAESLTTPGSEAECGPFCTCNVCSG